MVLKYDIINMDNEMNLNAATLRSSKPVTGLAEVVETKVANRKIVGKIRTGMEIT